jgi:hypothetical protein
MTFPKISLRNNTILTGHTPEPAAGGADPMRTQQFVSNLPLKARDKRASEGVQRPRVALKALSGIGKAIREKLPGMWASEQAPIEELNPRLLEPSPKRAPFRAPSNEASSSAAASRPRQTMQGLPEQRASQDGPPLAAAQPKAFAPLNLDLGDFTSNFDGIPHLRTPSPTRSPESRTRPEESTGLRSNGLPGPAPTPPHVMALVAEMGKRSPVSRKRLMKQSISEQAQYAKKLTREDRHDMGVEITSRIAGALRRNDMPAAKDAMAMWLSVQQASLRVHTEGQRTDYRSAQRTSALLALDPFITPFIVPHMRARREAYRADAARPEYNAAFDALMPVINSPHLPPELRAMAVEHVEREWLQDGSIAPAERMALRDRGVRRLAQEGYVVRPYDPEAAHLAEDVAKQKEPLGKELGRWVKRLDVKDFGDVHAFDDEPGARSFARVLARMAPKGLPLNRKTKSEAEEMIRAMGSDAEARAQIFSGAVEALGTCGDNVKLGWSRMVSGARNLKMAKDVQEKRVSREGLRQWAGQQFREQALDLEIHSAFAKHPTLPDEVEVSLYVKMKLKEELNLPAETPSSMQYRKQTQSLLRELKDFDRATLVQAVRQKEADPAAMAHFLLNHEVWRTGMETLHADEFKRLNDKHDENPFYEVPYPSQGPEFAAEQTAYNEAGAAVYKQRMDAQDALLMSLWFNTPHPWNAE